MNELRLLFDKAPDGTYTVRLDNNWGSNASELQPFKFSLTEDDHEDLRWYLEDFMDLPDGGSEVRARRVEQSIKDWGRELFQAVFDQADNRELFNHLLSLQAPRVLTIATRDPDPLRLPWETMANKRGPLTRLGITIRRQLETAGQPIEYATGLPLRILLVVSRPDDMGFIDPRVTTPSMLDALAPLGRDVTFDICRPPTLARLEEMLSEAQSHGKPYHIFHFDGHGTFMPEIELGILWFEKPAKLWRTSVKRDVVHADRLGNLLAAYSIPLALLDACRSGQPINDGIWMAHSTLMAIMGRMAAYTGKEISWTEALNSEEQLVPDNLTWNMDLPIRPMAMPGKTKFV